MVRLFLKHFIWRMIPNFWQCIWMSVKVKSKIYCHWGHTNFEAWLSITDAQLCGKSHISAKNNTWAKRKNKLSVDLRYTDSFIFLSQTVYVHISVKICIKMLSLNSTPQSAVWYLFIVVFQDSRKQSWINYSKFFLKWNNDKPTRVGPILTKP